MIPACILIAALLFISTEMCNGSTVLKHLDEDYKRAGELKKSAIFGGKVGSQYSRLFFVFAFSIFIQFFFSVTFKRLDYIF